MASRGETSYPLASEVAMLAELLLVAMASAGSPAEIAPPAPAPAPAPPSAPASEGTPHLTFDTVQVDLGQVVRGEDANATFTYHNTGTAPLHILSAKPG